MDFSSLVASSCGGAVVAVAMGFFCGACSTAALPSCPPVQPQRAAVKTKIAPTIASPRPRILILFSISKGYAAEFESVLLAFDCHSRPPRSAANGLLRRFAAVLFDQFVVVFIGGAGHAVERRDELLRPQPTAQE